MKKLTFSLILLTFAMSASAFTLIWNAPDGYTPDAYIVYHGTSSAAYGDINNAGAQTNFEWTADLPTGLNYFTVAAMAFDTNHILQMSGLSNEVVVTNSLQIVLTQVILTSTNVAGNWKPWSTNRLQFTADLPQEFFMQSPLQIQPMNIISVPTNAVNIPLLETNTSLKSPSVLVKKPKK